MNIATMSFKEFVSAIISNIIQPITVLIFALSILYFLWNVTQFIRKSDEPKEIEKFKTNAFWGIVAIFVMASLWGLVQILVNSFVPGTEMPVYDGNTNYGSEINYGRREFPRSEANPNGNINYGSSGIYQSSQ